MPMETAPPRLVLIAGPNGSGKSTITRKLMASGADFGVYINPDEIARQLDGNDMLNARRAQELAEEQRNELLDKGQSHSFESVMSHPSKIDYLVSAKHRGFHVTLIFVGVDDPKVNVARVAERVAQGGHDVPIDKIVSRYKRTMELLFDAVMVSDKAIIYDNTDRNKGLQLAAEVEGGHLKTYDKQFPWVTKYFLNKYFKLK